MRGLLEFLLSFILLWGAALLVFGIHSLPFDSSLLLFVAMLGVGGALALIGKRWGRGMLLLAIPMAVLLANYSAQKLWSPGGEHNRGAHVYSLTLEHNSSAPDSNISEAPDFVVQSAILPRRCPDTPDDPAEIRIIAGFDLHPIACNLQGVGDILIPPGGNTEVMYASMPESGTLYILQAPSRDNSTAPEQPPAPSMWRKLEFSSDLDRPMGLAWHSGFLYVATRTAVLRFNMAGSLSDQPLAETVVSGLPRATDTEHRALAIDSAANIYLPIGAGNAAPQKLQWQQAAVIRISPDAKKELFAAGLHHARALVRHPQTGALWAVDEGTETQGTSVPAGELNILKAGADYGWPFCYGFRVPDKELGTTNICNSTQPASAVFPPRSTPVALAFGAKLDAPQRYRSMLYAVLKEPAGNIQHQKIRIVGLPLDGQGDLSGWGVDVVSGMVTPTAGYAKPAAMAVSAQGDLYFADAAAGMVYRFEFPSDADMPENIKD